MKLNQPLCILCWVIALPLAMMLAVANLAPGAETLPAGVQVVAIEARPTSVELKHRFDYRQVLITGKLATGELVDLTRIAKASQSGKAVTISDDGLIRAAADGADEVTYSFESFQAKVPVKVAGVTAPHTVSFVQDVQPVLSRMGCNQGTCHGSKDGKNGFKLSLRGYDPLYDHRALTDDIGARRFNRAAPEQSLMLLKATGAIPHVGGVRTTEDSPYYGLVKEWVSQGVKLDLQSPRVTKIEVFPTEVIVPRIGMKQQITVMATFADGKTRDVTREAFIESGNIEVLEATTTGVVTSLRRGESAVLVRYEGAYAASTIIVMGDRSGFAWSNPPTNNYVDQHVYQKLQKVKILPSELCTDDEFIRRVYIDLTGMPPVADAVRTFLADGRDSRVKRDELVDRLVGSRAYVEHWTNKWSDLLQVNRKFLGEQGSVALRNWIKDCVAENKPYDQFAYEVLTASGSNMENPAAAYFKILRDPDSLMENTTHLFLAVRFNCNKCHDHPFERWTQDQYYQLSAYFAQIGRKEDPAFAGQKIGGSAVEGAQPLVETVFDSGSGEVKHLRTSQVVAPQFPYQHPDTLAAQASRRQQLAHWMTSKENQYFAKSQVNRIWGYLFGSGIIEPIDDIRAGNPPTNPELLEALTKDFVDSGFDVQHVIRTICKSRTYQHSIRTNKWNEDDTVNYSRSIPRRLTAEALYDAIHLATGSVERLPGLPVGFRAAEMTDAGGSNPFLDDFGKPVRESACECERSTGMVLGPIMKLVNGPTVADAIADPSNVLTKLATEEKDDAKLVEEVFLRFLARRPTPEEVKVGIESLKGSTSEHEKLVAALADYEKQLGAKQAAWEQTVGQPVTWTPLEPGEMKSALNATFAKKEDQSILVSGPTGKDTYSVTFATDAKGITGLKLEALADDALPAKGPGRAQNGNFVLNELKLSVAPKAMPEKKEAKGFKGASATFSQQSWDVAGAVDGNPGSGWAVHPKPGENHTAIFELKEPVGGEGGSLLTLEMLQEYVDGTHLLGRFRISATTAPNPLSQTKLPVEVEAALKVAADQRNDAQKQLLAGHFRSQDAQYAQLRQAVQQSADQLKNSRLIGVQDLAWALINSPAFLFNR
jgi:hypothetical protein